MSKVEQKPFKNDDSMIPEEISMDESNNSLRLFLSDDEQTEDWRLQKKLCKYKHFLFKNYLPTNMYLW